MKPLRRPSFRPLLTALLLGAASQIASATLINLDLSSKVPGLPGDIYGMGAGVFGGEQSRWNNLVLGGGGPTSFQQALVDETGAASGVTVHLGSPARPGLPNHGLSGRYNKLGGSSTLSSSSVTFSGLAAGSLYDLVVYGSMIPTRFTVPGRDGGESLLPVRDWSTLSEGSHYVLFERLSAQDGSLSFSGGHWSAVQLRALPQPAVLPPPGLPPVVMPPVVMPPAVMPPAPMVPPSLPQMDDPVTAVPEPSSAALLLLGGVALLAWRRLRRPGVGC